MREKFLHFVWQHRLYDSSSLSSLNGKSIQVISVGMPNTNAGPDFLNARIKIGETEWVGNVEIHTYSSHFMQHKHQDDSAFSNLILHVVYAQDRHIPFLDDSGTETLVLENRIADKLWESYRHIIEDKPKFIPCDTLFEPLEDLYLISWVERLMVERWEAKLEQALPTNKNNINWEQLFFVQLAKALGQTVNAEPMEFWARTLPWQVIQKCRNNRNQLHALLLGWAGFLDTDYAHPKVLKWQKEYKFLVAKFQLNQILKPVFKFFRLRPVSFPAIRIAQLTEMLLAKSDLFASFVLHTNVDAFKEFCDSLQPEEFWNTHYTLNKESDRLQVKPLSTAKTEQLIINAVLPISFAYRAQLGNPDYSDLIEFQSDLGAENNTITRGFKKLGWSAKSALDSQAQIHLKKKYCDTKKCLHCAFGLKILKK